MKKRIACFGGSVRLAALAIMACSFAWAGNGLESWENVMRETRPHLPAKETRSPKTLKAMALLKNAPSLAESQDLAVRTVGEAYGETAEWKTVFQSDEERIDIASVVDQGGVGRFAVYVQLGNPAAYYWTVDGLEVSGEPTMESFLEEHCLVDGNSRISAVDGLLAADDVEITTIDGPVAIPYARFHFAFVDDMPGANWAHPCRYVFISEDLTSFTVLYMVWRPSLCRKGSQDDIPFVRLSPAADDASYETLDEVKERVYNYAKDLEANAISYSAGEKSRSYFVILSGGAGKVSNGIRFWSDAAMLYATLTKKYGVNKDHIYALISDGNSTEEDANLNDDDTPVLVDSPRDLDGDGVEDVTDAATKDNLQKCLAKLKRKLGRNDQLFIFMTSHGSSDGTSGADNHDCRISMFSGGSLRDDELASWTKDFNVPVAVAVESCYSGGFVDDICETDNRAITTACNHYELSWGWGGGGAWSDGKSGKTGAFNCWAGPLNAAFRGCWPNPIKAKGYPWEDSSAVYPDSNNDGSVSFEEAATFARANDAADKEHPQYETTSGTGAAFFILNQFEYVTEEKQVSLSSSGDMMASCSIAGGGDSWRLLEALPSWINTCTVSNANGSVASLRHDSTVAMNGNLSLEIVADENTSETEGRECAISIYNVTRDRIEYTINVNQKAKDPTYTITYSPGMYGSGEQLTDTKVHDIDITLQGAIFTRTGYRQSGWSKTDGGFLDYSLSTSYTSNAPLTLYPYWTANSYSVTLDRQGGSSGTVKVSAVFDRAMPSIGKPTRTGYTFGGYYLGPDGAGTMYYGADGASAHDWDQPAATTLYARWLPVFYTVTLNQQSGSGGTETVSAPYEGELPPIEIPVRTGYVFDGYFSGKKGTGTRYYNADGTGAAVWDKTRAATIYANWRAQTYKVALDPQGGSGGTEVVDATFDSAMPAITKPLRDGYEFGGYFSGLNAAGTMYYSGDGSSAHSWDIAKSATLYAHWRAFDFEVPEIEVEEGAAVEIRILGGSDRVETGVKLYLAYETAVAADLDLAKGAVDGETPKGGLKFPLALSWKAGEVRERVVSIPVKTDKAVENREFFMLQLGDASGLDLGARRTCKVTVVDPGYDELARKIESGMASKAEIASWNKLQTNGFFIRGLADPANAGKVTGSAYCADGKKVALKASANKGFVFTGWTLEGEEPPAYVATTAGLTVDRTAKPAKSSATVTVLTDVSEASTYIANYVTTEEDKIAISLEAAGPCDSGDDPVWTVLDEDTVPGWTVMRGVTTEWPLSASGLSAITLKAAGLPSGLKLVQDSTTKEYSISGIATVASKTNAKTGVTTPSKVKLTATSAGKSSKVYNIDVTVTPLYDWAQGTFTGYVWDGSDDNLVGAVQSFAVTAAGKISGKVQRGTTAYTLTGNGFTPMPSDTQPALLATVVEKAGKIVTTNTVAVSESGIELEDGTALGMAEGVDWVSFQNLWKGATLKPIAAKMAKAPLLTLRGTADGLPTDADTMTVKVAATGVATVKATFVTGVNAKTGKPITASASATAPLVPAEGDGYTLYVYMPLKGAFPGYSAVIALSWNGSEFSLK